MKVVEETAKRLPKSRFAIVEPMERPAVSWYTRGLKDITSEYSRRINNLGLVNIMIIKRVDLPAQVFVEDQVHLSPAAGKSFVGSTLYYEERFFEADLVELDDRVIAGEGPDAGGCRRSRREGHRVGGSHRHGQEHGDAARAGEIG